MNLGEAYRAGKTILEKAGVDSPSFDAGSLFQKVFGLSLEQRVLHSREPAHIEQTEEYLRMAGERAAGRPLQYILGEWPFLSFTLRVGEGVLIPREETELLVRTASDLLKESPAPRVLDLCSGSGAVALGLTSFLPGAQICAVEKYPAALSYLKENIRRAGFPNVRARELDVFDPASADGFAAVDGIVSNPPYVRGGELASLQREVRREPREALDGGEDGLDFYRAIAGFWLPKLKPGGAAAVEVGDGQAAAVRDLFGGILENITVFRDFGGVERVISGRRAEL